MSDVKIVTLKEVAKFERLTSLSKIQETNGSKYLFGNKSNGESILLAISNKIQDRYKAGDPATVLKGLDLTILESGGYCFCGTETTDIEEMF